MKKSRTDCNERRVSPAMRLWRHFFSYRPACVGSGILLFIILFSFPCRLLSPYDESQVFLKTETMLAEVAVAVENQDYRFVTAADMKFSSAAQMAFLKSLQSNTAEFSADGTMYCAEPLAERFYRIWTYIPVASVPALVDDQPLTFTSDFDGDHAGLSTAYQAAFNSGLDQFTFAGESYRIQRATRIYQILRASETAIASVMTLVPSQASLGLDFRREAELAFRSGKELFLCGGETYTLSYEDGAALISHTRNGTQREVAYLSDLLVRSMAAEPLDTAYIRAIRAAIRSKSDIFSYRASAVEDIVQYTISRENGQYHISTEKQTSLIAMYEPPSRAHWLGTDSNGMDILTRLMYGGRVSLTVSFAVVALELLIGGLIGGLASCFGGWTDMVLMRFADVVSCIPAYPLYITIGGVMDVLQIAPRLRIYIMMGMLAALSWVPMARLVRGQLLSLREREFILAAEAMGIGMLRRLFHHLLPNIVPHLSVAATLSLGNVILTEATLSFLGLGVKFPYASWGNIIHAVSDIHVMTNYLFAWIPAGIFILLTVLSFHLIGDALRMTLDPKSI